MAPLSHWLRCRDAELLSRWRKCLWPFAFWSWLRQHADAPRALGRNRRLVWAVIAESTLRGGLSEADWLWELAGICRPGPPLIIFKSASHWMPPLSSSLLTRAYLNMDRWSRSPVCHFYSRCNHASIGHYWWCQNSWWLKGVRLVYKHFIKFHQSRSTLASPPFA